MLREAFAHASLILYQLTVDFIRLLGSFLQSGSALAAENLFLRKQLGLYQERQFGLNGPPMQPGLRWYCWQNCLIGEKP